MTRLHEQLHKESTLEEEELTLTMLSDEAKQRIIQMLQSDKSLNFPLGHQSSHYPVYICEPSQRHCKLTVQTAFRKKAERCWGCEYFLRPESKESCWIEECICKKSQTGCYEYNCGLKPAYKVQACRLKLNDCQYRWDRELEKICNRGNFLIGYIDIYYSLKWEATCDLEITPTWTWAKFQSMEGRQSIIIECKPEMKRFQGVLRQIKTYMDVLRSEKPIGIIATYSEVPDSVVKLLRSEGVYVLNVPKSCLGEKKGSQDLFSTTERGKA